MARTSRAKLATSSLAWFGGFTLSGWLLSWLGRFPFLRIDWSDPLRWLTGADPLNAFAAISRIAGLAIVGWVGVTTAVYLLARLLGAKPQPIRWLSVGPLRRAVDALLAGSLLVTTMAPAGAVGGPSPSPPPLTAPVVSSGEVAPGYVPVPAGIGVPPIEIHESTSETGSNSPAPDELTVIVAPGDNLWVLAKERLATNLGRAPSDAETAPYWVQVVEVNRERLRSGDPDLIFPGEEVMLPPISLDG